MHRLHNSNMQRRAQAALDGASLALQGPCALLVPALVPHGFVFAPEVDGTVITVLEPHLQRLLHNACCAAPRHWRRA